MLFFKKPKAPRGETPRFFDDVRSASQATLCPVTDCQSHHLMSGWFHQLTILATNLVDDDVQDSNQQLHFCTKFLLNQTGIFHHVRLKRCWFDLLPRSTLIDVVFVVVFCCCFCCCCFGYYGLTNHLFDGTFRARSPCFCCWLLRINEPPFRWNFQSPFTLFLLLATTD